MFTRYHKGLTLILSVIAVLVTACTSSVPPASPSDFSTAAIPYLAKMLPQSAGSVAKDGKASISYVTPSRVDGEAGDAALLVTATQPSDGSTEVNPATQIIVVFNKPVVPLTGVDAQADLPSPISVSPAVTGKGEWINTSVYSFQPDGMLDGATAYSVTVVDVMTTAGETLAEPYVFTFTTSSPTVVDAEPTGNLVPPDAEIKVIFSQPMHEERTAAAFSLRRSGDGVFKPIKGAVSFDAGAQTLVFTPSVPLEFGQSYAVEVSTEAVSANGTGSLREPFEQQFSIAPYPDIINITPENGAENVLPESSVVLRFNTHISRTQVLEEVTVSPLISTTSVYSYYSAYNDELTLSWNKEPNTTYTITVGGAIEDDYGNSLGEDRIFTFTTGDFMPLIDLELERFTHFSASDETRVGMLYRNVDEVVVDLYRLPETEMLKLAGGDQWQVWDKYSVPNPDATKVWSRTYDTSGDPNVAIRQIITLTEQSGNLLATGAYFISAAAPQTTLEYEERLNDEGAIILSEANLVVKKSNTGESLAWLTDLLTGQPIGDTSVRFTMDGNTVGQAVTDDEGVALLPLEMPADRSWVPLVAISGDEGSENYAVASTEWSQGISPWDFGLMAGYGSDRYKGHFYTERPIYRPGDTVYWKGVIRSLVDNGYRLPELSLPVSVLIRDDMGDPVYLEQLTLSDMGTVHDSLDLSEEASTGYYYLEARIGEEGVNQTVTGTGFQVAEYRKPEFEVSVESSQPEYIQGDTVRIDVRANYFSGGALANAPVTWRLIAEPYYFSWSDENGRWYDFSPYDPDSEAYDPYRGIYALGLVNEGSGETDANGTYSLEVPADISKSLQSQNWAFDVTLMSPTNQYVTGSVSAPIHRAGYYAGIAPRSYIASVGESAQIDFVTVTPDREFYAGADLTVTVVDFDWNSVYERAADGSYRWETSVERTPVYTTSLTTNREGQAVLAWTPEQAGQYQIVASGVDDAGNPVNSATFLWVSAGDSDDYVAWPMQNNDRIDIVADKQSYAPGETARILVPSPFQGSVNALVTTERAGVMDSALMTLNANSELIEVPITEEHIPNFFVSVILVKGVDESNPFPAMRIGYVMLPVDTDAIELAVDVESSAATVAPGDTVTYTLQVRDSDGNPVANSEVSAAVIDKAVLSLSGQQGETMLEAFYRERPLDVLTGATLVINQDRISQQLSEGAKGGGGGGGGMLEVRGDFSDVAYWQADLRTDDEGRIQFSVDLPDSLTTWRLIAKAVTDDTKVGETTYDVVATKELQIRPLAPRFLSAGDRPWLGAQLINTADVEVRGVLTVTLFGAAFDNNLTQTMAYTLLPGEQTTQSWPAEVSSDSSEVSILASTVGASVESAATEYSDAIQISLPVNRYESPETVATSGAVPEEGVAEYILLPDDATDQGSLQVRVEPSLASGMLRGLDYLQHFPYECNEQVVSRFLPNLVTVNALRALEIEDSEFEAQLAYNLGVGVQMLVSRQNPDGGWGYWPGEVSSRFITAYVLWGIGLAEEQGFAVPQETTKSAIDYLDSQFQAPTATQNAWQLNEMAFVHYVLSELGAGDPGRASTLYDVRENLGVYGKALLAMALANMNEQSGGDPRVDTLLDDIVGAAIITATGVNWEEDGIDFWTLNTDTRTTSIALAALARLRPDQPLLPQTVRWMMLTREAGRWRSTQENAWAIISLTDWMVISKELQGDYEWLVELNDNNLGSGAVEPYTISKPVDLVAPIVELLREEANILLFSRSNSSGALYYTTHLQYFLDASAIDSRDRGIVIDRRFALETDPDGRSVNSAAIGDVISVTVTIIAPTDLHHVLVEAPIPAGTEPIDPGLAITDPRFMEPQVELQDSANVSGWWRHWIPSNIDYRDDKVALFSTYLPAGTYEYTFSVRASTPGEYRVLPAYAEMMYFNEVWGRSAGALFTVKR